MPPRVTARQYQGQVHEQSRALMTDWTAALARAEAERQPTAAIMISIDAFFESLDHKRALAVR